MQLEFNDKCNHMTKINQFILYHLPPVLTVNIPMKTKDLLFYKARRLHEQKYNLDLVY